MEQAIGPAVAGTFFVGIVATAIGDGWAIVARTVFNLPTANWGIVGRWICGFRRGVFVHEVIAKAPAVRGETQVGWIAHYAIGVGFAFLYLMIIGALADGRSTLASALAFGLATILAPLLVMKPAFGMGIGGLRAPQPFKGFVSTVTAHLAFGVGLHVATELCGFVGTVGK